MEFTAQSIATYLKGTVEGNPDVQVSTFAKIEDGHAGALSFLANPKYEHYLYTTKSSIVIVGKAQSLSQPVKATLIRVDDAYQAFAELLQLYQSNMPTKQGREEPVFVAPTASLGADLYIGAFAYISEGARIADGAKIYPQVFIGENVSIGARTVIYPGVKIYRDCVVGDDCIIHSGAVIGADGFGFAPQSGTDYKKVPQIGNVIIEDWVEIGANTCIDRATMGSTRIRRGVKLDNLVQIAHNVEVGENTVMAAMVGIAGSTKIGANSMFGGQSGAVGHLNLAEGSKFGAQTGIISSIKEPNEVFMGTPAMPYSTFLKSSVLVRKLPEMMKRIDALEKKVKD